MLRYDVHITHLNEIMNFQLMQLYNDIEASEEDRKKKEAEWIKTRHWILEGGDGNEVLARHHSLNSI